MSVHGKAFWASLVVGGAIMAYGVFGLFADGNRTHPVSFLIWFGGAAAVHELVVAPIVVAVGVGVVRITPVRLRAPVAAGLIVAGSIGVYAVPFLLGFGDKPTNPSALPNDYARNLVVIVVGITAAVVVASVVRSRRPARR